MCLRLRVPNNLGCQELSEGSFQAWSRLATGSIRSNQAYKPNEESQSFRLYESHSSIVRPTGVSLRLLAETF